MIERDIIYAGLTTNLDDIRKEIEKKNSSKTYKGTILNSDDVYESFKRMNFIQRENKYIRDLKIKDVNNSKKYSQKFV